MEAYKYIDSEGKVAIPKKILSATGLKEGEKVRLRVVDRKVMLESAKIRNISGALKVSEKIIDELVEKEELFEP